MKTARRASHTVAALAITSLVTFTATSQADATTLNYSLGLGPGSDVALAAEVYADSVAEASGGELTIRVFPLELVSLAEMGPGIRDGLTDIGYMAAPYYPSEFAHSNFLAELSMLQAVRYQTGKEDLAYAGAMTQYIMQECEDCLDEFKAQNHVYMGHIASSPYVLLCRSEIRTSDDLRGKRLRTGSAAYRRLAEHFGAVGVQLPASEAYEALSQGVLDCALLGVPELTNFRLMEVVNAITLRVPGNVYGGTVAGNINRDTWQALNDEQRAILLEKGAYLAAGITWNYHSSHQRDLEAAGESGKVIIEPDQSLLEGVENFVEADMDVIAELFSTNYGVTDAEQMKADFEPLLERWSGLVADVSSAEELGELYWSEIFSKLDPAAYGMD